MYEFVQSSVVCKEYFQFRLTNSIEDLEMAVKGGNTVKIGEAQKKFIQNCKDPLSDWLDCKYGLTVTENAIFAALPAYWEKEFHKDMDSLNVL